MRIEEDVATNCAGSGAVQGIGTGDHPASEPGVKKKKKLSVILNKAKVLKRRS